MAAIVAVLLGGLLSAAIADVDQDGRRTASTSVDGSFVRLEGNGFSPANNQCVIYGVLSYDSSAPRQIESGLVRCDSGTSIDGTCPGGQVFVERYNGSSYFCTPGYSFNNNTQYDATTYRNSSSSTTFTGHINGSTLTQGGFGLSDNIRGYAWGEATGGSTCPSPSRGTFHVWQRYNTSSGWSYVDGSSVFRYDNGMNGAPCWGSISAADSSGGFDVD